MKKTKRLISYIMLTLAIFNAVPVYALEMAGGFFDYSEPIEEEQAVEEDNFDESVVEEETIIDEIIDQREADKKYFRTSHGNTMVAIYPTDVHYKKDGKYVDIDNTLYEDKGVLRNKANDFVVSFAKTSRASNSSKLFTVEKDGKKLEMSLLGSMAATGRVKDFESEEIGKILFNPAILMDVFKYGFNVMEESENEKKLKVDNTKSQIEYKSILNNIDVTYDVMPNKVKESIILGNRNVNNVIEFNLNMSEGLTAVLLKDNSIEIREKEDLIYLIERPYMFDASQVYSDSIKVDLIENDKSYLIRLTIDSEWLNDKERKYPVVVDPTITTKQEASSISDTYIYNGDAGTAPYRMYEYSVRVGNSAINSARGLFKFDLPINLQSGDQIINAQFILANYHQHLVVPPRAYSTTAFELNVHQMKTNWESVSAYWNNLSATSNYNTKVTDYCMYKYSTTAPFGSGCNFDITSIVKDWYLNNNNYGLMVKEPVEQNSSRGQAEFVSSDYPQSVGTKPAIVITYRNQTGLEDYQAYSSHAIGNTTVHTNNYNGNLILTHQDVTTPGMVLPVSINHVYNTNDTNGIGITPNIGYGNGFRLNLNQTIIEEPIDGTTYLKYIDEDGTRHYFPKTTSPYKDEDGLGLKVTVSGTNYIMEDKGGNKSTFVKNGTTWYLKTITDTNGKTIDITYNSSNYNLITSVKDGAGKVVNLAYANNLLSTITDLAGRVTTYTYTSSNLTGIKYPDNKTIAYTFDGNKLLTKVTAIDGSYSTYTYTTTTPYRVLTMSEYGTNATLGNKLTLTYGENTTKLTDNKSNVNNYVFNNWGQTTSITDLGKSTGVNNAYGINYKYDNDTGKENKLTLAGNLIKSTNNYFVNSSFENNLTNWSISQVANYPATVDTVTTEKIIGDRSLRINSTSLDSFSKIFQELPLVKGKTYTFSAYIKGTISEKSNASSGPIIYLSYEKADGTIGSQLNWNPEITSSWDRYSFTFTVPSDAVGYTRMIYALKYAKGTMYVDNVQLEEGEVANPYNLVDNSGFDRDDLYWVKSGNLTSSDLVQTVDSSKAWKMTGDPTLYKNISQTIPMVGKKGDLLNISFWMKHQGTPLASGRHAGVIVYFQNSAGTKLQEIIVNGNADSSAWQYVSDQVTANQDYASLKVHVVNNKNKGTIFYDNIGVYKDEFATGVIYDTNGNITSLTNKDNQNSSFVYDKRNELISSTSNKGRKTINEYQYNIQNRLLRTFEPSGIVNEYAYDSNGNVTQAKTTESYQVNTIDTSKVYYIKATGSNLYVGIKGDVNISGSNVELITKGPQAEWVFIPKGSNYEIRPNLTTATRMDIQGANQNDGTNVVIHTSNNNIAQQFKVVNNNDGTFSLQTSVTNNTKCVDVASAIVYTNGTNIQQYTCNNTFAQNFILEEVTSSSTLKYTQTNNAYSSDGRYNTSNSDQRGKTTTTNYNVNTGTVASVINANNSTTSYDYDIMNKVTSVTSGNTTNSYTYTNDYLSTINHNGFSYNFLYDTYGNTSSISLGNQIHVTNSYGANNGNLLSNTYGNGNVISYAYDNLNRVSTKTTGIGTVAYSYDNRGNAAKLVSKNTGGTVLSTIYNNYDISNRLVKSSEERGTDKYTVKYSYDKYSNISSKVYYLDTTSKTRNFTYNNDDKITQIGSSTYTYDGLDRVSTKKVNNTYLTKYNYLDINATRTTNILESIENGLNKISYSYDNIGNITQIKENNTVINEYEYDTLNELIVDKDYKHNKKYEFNYDNAGNLTSKVIKNLTSGATIDTISYTYGNNNWNDQLTNFNGKAITYDVIGNPLTYGSNICYTWQNSGQLTTYADTSKNLSVSYKYNDNGIRTEKTVNNVTTKYYLEGSNIIYEDRNGTVIYYFYDASGVTGFEYNNNTYHFVKNIQGDVIGILDSSYNQVVSYEYDSWGNILDITDNSGINLGEINPYRYRSYYWDTETSMYYLNQRYYVPEWSRFLNADGIIGANIDILAYNLYAYVSNNPIMFSDYNGESIFGDIKNAFFDYVDGALQGAITYVVETPQRISDTVTNIKKNPVKTISGMMLGGLFSTTAEYSKIYNMSKLALKGDFKSAGELYGPNVARAATTCTVDAIIKSATTPKKVHGNSLKTTKPAQGYALVDKNTGQIMKYGETTMGPGRYSKTYLASEGVEMQFLANGTKYQMHYWQHDMILNHKATYGARPKMNLNDW